MDFERVDEPPASFPTLITQSSTPFPPLTALKKASFFFSSSWENDPACPFVMRADVEVEMRRKRGGSSVSALASRRKRETRRARQRAEATRSSLSSTFRASVAVW